MTRKSARSTKKLHKTVISNQKSSSKGRTIQKNRNSRNQETHAILQNEIGDGHSEFLCQLRKQKQYSSTFFAIYQHVDDDAIPDYVLAKFKNKRHFIFRRATDILENAKYVLDTKSIMLIDQLVPRKNCIFAVANAGSTLTITNHLDRLNGLGNAVDRFVKNAIKEAKEISDQITINSSKGNKTKRLISYQNFQYKMSKIRDEVKKMRLNSSPVVLLFHQQ